MKRIFSVIAAAAAFVSLFFGTSEYAYADAPKKIAVLGDSIAEGFGLPEGALSYADYLGEYYGAQVGNFGVSGYTTDDLMQAIETDEINEYIRASDLICVSVGGNDVLDVFFGAASEIMDYSLYDENGGEELFSGEAAADIIRDYASEIGSAAKRAGINVGLIRDRLRELNPSAVIVFQTIYNPFATENERLRSSMYAMNKFTELYIGTINKAIKQLEDVKLADIHKKFEGKEELYTNIDIFDIHPSSVGHMMIAEEIIQVVRETGSPDVFEEELPKFLGQLKTEDVSELGRLIDGKLRIEETLPVVTVAETADTTEVTAAAAEPDGKVSKAKEEKGFPWAVLVILPVAAAAAYCEAFLKKK